MEYPLLLLPIAIDGGGNSQKRPRLVAQWQNRDVSFQIIGVSTFLAKN